MRQQIGLLRADFWDEYASSQRNPRNPCCYRYVGLTNSRHCRLVSHVSPLGTRGSFRVGPPEIYFKALVANRRHAGRVYRMGLDRLWGKRHLRIVEVAAHLSRQSPIETLGRGGWVTCTLSAVISGRESVPIGDTLQHTRGSPWQTRR
jgi:hypothetical protein